MLLEMLDVLVVDSVPHLIVWGNSTAHYCIQRPNHYPIIHLSETAPMSMGNVMGYVADQVQILCSSDYNYIWL